MIAPSRGAAYRRFYLYSALSVAAIALSIAAALLLREMLQFAIFREMLQRAGFGVRFVSQDTSRSIALAVALIAFAAPVGGAHLWLILHSLADPAERATGIRHQFLNLWVAFALVAVLLSGQSLISLAVSSANDDLTAQLSIMVVAAAVGAIAAWWIARTPPATAQHRVRASVAVLFVSMAVAALSLANAASAAGYLFGYPVLGSRFDPSVFQQQTLWSGLLTAGLALTIWSFGFAWQRAWPKTRDRLGYALFGYGIGTAILVPGVCYVVAGAIRFASDPSEVGAFTSPWSAVAAGLLLVVVHAAVLFRDRGRNGHPAVTTDRLLLAFPALVGLGVIVGGLGLASHALAERDAIGPRHLSDDLTQAATLLTVGLLAYVPSWLAFAARAGVGSAVRRFYLFTVACLALVAGLVSGVIVLYSAITALVGVSAGDYGRTALTWLTPALALAAIFATHIMLLLRDQRRTSPAEVTLPADPLVALLEDVRAGRVNVEHAAETIRGPRS